MLASADSARSSNADCNSKSFERRSLTMRLLLESALALHCQFGGHLVGCLVPEDVVDVQVWWSKCSRPEFCQLGIFLGFKAKSVEAVHKPHRPTAASHMRKHLPSRCAFRPHSLWRDKPNCAWPEIDGLPFIYMGCYRPMTGAD